MQQEDNVYGKTTPTGDITEVKAQGGESAREQNASTVAGKFKSVDALIRAYESLQAEFTRRNQRLKELERAAENLKTDSGADGERSGAEKLRKNAEVRRAEAKAFDAFVEDVGKAHEDAEGPVLEERVREATTQKKVEIAEDGACAQKQEEESENKVKSCGEDGTDGEKADAVTENAAHKPVAGKETTSEDLYLRVCNDEKVRLRIIGEYLTSLGKSAPPLTAGGVGTLATPPLKAKNIRDAGVMALQYFKKPFEIV